MLIPLMIWNDRGCLHPFSFALVLLGDCGFRPSGTRNPRTSNLAHAVTHDAVLDALGVGEMTGSTAAPTQGMCERQLRQAGRIGDVNMRIAEDGGRRQGATWGHSVTQVFYADGEKMGTAVIRAVLHHCGAKVIHFDNVQDCLDSLRTCECHLLISNAPRPAVEGVKLLRDAKRIVPSVPVVMMVDHADIETAVRAMKGGAVDCMERPPEQEHLLSVLSMALHESGQSARPKTASLSPTEKQVLQFILRGQTTAETARTLCRSRRTIEVHRSHIMRKLQVDGMVDLVRKCAQLGLLKDWP